MCAATVARAVRVIAKKDPERSVPAQPHPRAPPTALTGLMERCVAIATAVAAACAPRTRRRVCACASLPVAVVSTATCVAGTAIVAALRAPGCPATVMWFVRLILAKPSESVAIRAVVAHKATCATSRTTPAVCRRRETIAAMAWGIRACVSSTPSGFRAATDLGPLVAQAARPARRPWIAATKCPAYPTAPAFCAATLRLSPPGTVACPPPAC